MFFSFSTDARFHRIVQYIAKSREKNSRHSIPVCFCIDPETDVLSVNIFDCTRQHIWFLFRLLVRPEIADGLHDP